MAFNKVFIILALATCALAMPVLPADDQNKPSSEAESTPTFVNVEAEDSTAAVETILPEETVATTTSDDDDSTLKTSVPEQLIAQDVAKRSIEEETDNDDLETAAGTNLLRPLFVYRQQVAYRQRVKNANRFRGNRRF